MNQGSVAQGDMEPGGPRTVRCIEIAGSPPAAAFMPPDGGEGMLVHRYSAVSYGPTRWRFFANYTDTASLMQDGELGGPSRR